MDARLNSEKTKELTTLLQSESNYIRDLLHLLRAGADPNVKKRNGDGLLHSSTDSFIYYLGAPGLKDKLDINLPNDKKLTPLQHVMATKPFSPERAMSLVRMGANPDTIVAGIPPLLHMLLDFKNRPLNVILGNIYELVRIYHADFFIKDGQGRTCLEFLLSYPEEFSAYPIVETIAFLVKAGADPNSKSPNGIPLLSKLILICDERVHAPLIIELINHHGIDIHAKDRKGNSALDYAFRKKDIIILKALLSAGAKPSEALLPKLKKIKDLEDILRPHVSSTSSCEVPLIRNVNESKQMQSPSQATTRLKELMDDKKRNLDKFFNEALTLIYLGADLNVRGEDDLTLLQRVMQDSPFVLERAMCLVRLGADVNTKFNGVTLSQHIMSLTFCFPEFKYPILMELLSIHKADLSIPDSDPRKNKHHTLLEMMLNWWAWYPYLNECFACLHFGADPNSRDDKGNTLLLKLIQRNTPSTKKYILDLIYQFKADVNITNNENVSPLECAVKKGNFEIARILLLQGAQIKNISVYEKIMASNNISLITLCHRSSEGEKYAALTKTPKQSNFLGLSLFSHTLPSPETTKIKERNEKSVDLLHMQQIYGEERVQELPEYPRQRMSMSG